MTSMIEYLQPGKFVDSDHRDVVAFAGRVVGDAGTDRDKAVRLFYAVRDGWRYDPYNLAPGPEANRASSVLAQSAGWCVSKSVLLCAASRAVGVPTRLGFADVKNHLTSEKLRASMASDLFAWHGYVEFWLDERWVKASSAFNIEMCERFGTKPLDFDGVNDSLMHEFDQAGNRHMQYMNYRGTFADLPWAEMQATFRELYPSWSQLLDGPVHDEAFHATPADASA